MGRIRNYTALIVTLCLAAMIILYLLLVRDNSLNFRKRNKVRLYAEAYIADTYPDFDLKSITTSYNKELNYYIADCHDADGSVITLNYNTDLVMDFDSYYNEKYTDAKTDYQSAMEDKLKTALENSGIPCDSIAVYVELDTSDKNNIVHNNGRIEGERIECFITYVRKEGESVLNKYEFAELGRSVSKCIYAELDKGTARIATLKIKYDYDETQVASLSWNRRMDEMSLAEISEEIKY